MSTQNILCNLEQQRQIKPFFFEKYHFSAIGKCTDCTNVAIVMPVNNDKYTKLSRTIINSKCKFKISW